MSRRRPFVSRVHAHRRRRRRLGRHGCPRRQLHESRAEGCLPGRQEALQAPADRCERVRVDQALQDLLDRELRRRPGLQRRQLQPGRPHDDGHVQPAEPVRRIVRDSRSTPRSSPSAPIRPRGQRSAPRSTACSSTPVPSRALQPTPTTQARRRWPQSTCPWERIRCRSSTSRSPTRRSALLHVHLPALRNRLIFRAWREHHSRGPRFGGLSAFSGSLRGEVERARRRTTAPGSTSSCSCGRRTRRGRSRWAPRSRTSRAGPDRRPRAEPHLRHGGRR